MLFEFMKFFLTKFVLSKIFFIVSISIKFVMTVDGLFKMKVIADINA